MCLISRWGEFYRLSHTIIVACYTLGDALIYMLTGRCGQFLSTNMERTCVQLGVPRDIIDLVVKLLGFKIFQVGFSRKRLTIRGDIKDR